MDVSVYLAVGSQDVGRRLCAFGQVDFIHFFEKATRALLHFDFDLFFQDIWPILWPMMVGCIPYYIAAWLASYYLVKKALEKIGGNGGKKLMPETGKNTDEGLS